MNSTMEQSAIPALFHFAHLENQFTENQRIRALAAVSFSRPAWKLAAGYFTKQQ
jgi:hypothetical protein